MLLNGLDNIFMPGEIGLFGLPSLDEWRDGFLGCVEHELAWQAKVIARISSPERRTLSTKTSGIVILLI